MLPQVAQHPRQLSQQFGSPGFATPPFESIPSPRRPERLAPLPFRNARTYGTSSTLAPLYRAFPVVHHDLGRSSHARSSSLGQSFREQYNDPSEHTLRRKTPNGTLAAGYDGTPVGWSSKPPALKHVVLPVSNGSSSSPNGSFSPEESRSQRIKEDFNWNYVQTSSIKRFDVVDSDPASWSQLPSMLDPSRNVWDQIGTYPASSYYPNNGMQIPTVLQPPYQPSPGPTASNDGGFYGLCWPDGRFVPYRPAAVRDQGNHHLSHGLDLQRDFEPRHVPVVDAFQTFRGSYVSDKEGPFQHGANTSLSLQRSKLGASEVPYTPYQLQSHELNNNFYVNTPDGSQTPTGPSLHRANNSHFKEKTLSWAHAIYVDLLAHIHQSKKENGHTRNSRGSRNSIYPKPPRQPASHLGSSTWAELGADDSYRRHSTTALRGHHPGSISSNNHGSWQSHRTHSEQRYGRSSNPEMPHYVSPFVPPQIQAISPRDKARQALDMLTTLCDQSDWTWIDAMLLGGCLAYGLEDYHTAIDWYSKILDRDSQHVEAMSNLAAALKSSNRRQEAENYWMQAIRLRPTYFEAVEHLIGLFCENHRGPEAVRVVEFVESRLRLPTLEESHDHSSETSSNADRNSYDSTGASSEAISFDYDPDDDEHSFDFPSMRDDEHSSTPGFGSSGFRVPGSENGRILALVHAKGNMLYAQGNIEGASKAFEDAVLISAGRKHFHRIQDLIKKIVDILSLDRIGLLHTAFAPPPQAVNQAPLLLPPDKALQTARLVFVENGDLPGLRHVAEGLAKKAAISTTSNSLLSLAKIFQDAMSSTSRQKIVRGPTGVGDILALYYLSLSLSPSPSTANNVGILLASVQQPPPTRHIIPRDNATHPTIPGVVPGSGVALALAYYNYGLNLDPTHAHIYTNLGSLLKDIGQLQAAISMYEKAVNCDGSFDIALANLANAVKDQGRTSDAIMYYRRAVASSPDFAEAVCGLANALNSVCDWTGRGGVILDGGRQDRWHVDESGMLTNARANGNGGGWMKNVVDIVAKQLKDGSSWGRGVLDDQEFENILAALAKADSGGRWSDEKRSNLYAVLSQWRGKEWEGARVLRLIERATQRATYRWYLDRYTKNRQLDPSIHYLRPQLPSSLTVPSAPTVLPFHTFTCPLSAKDIRKISQRNGLRISFSTLRAPWMPRCVFPPPAPPRTHLNIGYVSSDFNNHPLAHLMQSVFGLHNPTRAKAFCYATTASDNSVHRKQIEREAPVFRDASGWPADRLVQQIVQDQIHILVNLNGYTRGARNEVFAARPAPIQMSFMGFAGTLGAEWCDYILADETAIPPDTLRPWRRNLELEDLVKDQEAHEEEDWVYSENIIFCRSTFFCCDHAQSGSKDDHLSWEEEQHKRWAMRKELFPSLSDDAIILGNFNQLYKIEPTTFRTWLRILDKVPKAILWLLRFPDLGESNLKRTARDWAGENVASRIWFTDVAPKHQHISRARVCDLFLDTPECNAHTTAADVLWSSTPLLTLPRYKYKMCSRMAASILKGALPNNEEGRKAAQELIAEDDDQYEEFAIKLANSLSYNVSPYGKGKGVGRLHDLRKLLYESRWTCALFDTKRWVSDLEEAYVEAWRKWVANEGGDIYL